MNTKSLKKGARRGVKRIVIKSDVKRIIIPLLFVLFMVIMSSSASATAIITIGDSDIYTEATVTVPLMINDVEDVAAATIKVSYDPSVIVVTDVGNSDFESFTPNLWYAEEGWVKITGYNIVEGMSGNVKFAELTITPKGSSGEISNLEIEVEALSNSKGVPIDAEVKNRSFYIGEESDFQPSPEPSPTPAPSVTTVPASSSTRSSPLHSPTPSVNETIPPTPSPLPAQTEEPAIITVQVGDLIVGKGDFANTFIMIKGVRGEGLSCALINLTYDPSVVEVISVENSDFDMFIPNIIDGKVRMVAYQTSAEGLKGDIKFAEIQVKAVGKANESSELGLEVKELKDNEGFPVHFKVENGYFMIERGEKAEPEEPLKTTILILSVLVIIAVIMGSYFAIRLRRRK